MTEAYAGTVPEPPFREQTSDEFLYYLRSHTSWELSSLAARNLVIDLCNARDECVALLEQVALLRKDALYAELQRVMAMHNETIAERDALMAAGDIMRGQNPEQTAADEAARFGSVRHLIPDPVEADSRWILKSIPIGFDALRNKRSEHVGSGFAKRSRCGVASKSGQGIKEPRWDASSSGFGGNL